MLRFSCGLSRHVDIYGLPSISVPCGFTIDGLQIGLQISSAHFALATLITLAHAYERATDWHRRRPDLSNVPAVVHRSSTCRVARPDRLRTGS